MPRFANAVLNELPFCWVTSRKRTTPLPSYLTVGLHVAHVVLPFVLLETRPPPAVPGSSPTLVLRLAADVATLLPSILVFFVPFARLLDAAMFT